MKDLKYCFKLLTFNPKFKSNIIVSPIAFFFMAIIFDIIALARDDLFPIYPFIVPMYLCILPNFLETGFATLDQSLFFRTSPIHKDFMVRLLSKFYLISSIISFLLTIIVIMISVAIRPDLNDIYMLSMLSVLFSFAIVIPLSTVLKSSYSWSVALTAIIILIPMFLMMIFGEDLVEFIGHINPIFALIISFVFFIIQIFAKLYVIKKYYTRSWSDYYRKIAFELQK